MSNCERKALLLSGPQYYNERRPVVAQLRRFYENVDPLGIAIVNAVLKRYDFETKWLPMNPGKIDRLEPAIEQAGFVFISARHFDTALAQKTIEIANRHKKPTITGGYGPTLNPSAFEKATIRIKGEAEPVIDQVIDDLLTDRLEPIYDATKLPPFSLDEYIWPDRSIFPSSPGKNPFKEDAQEWSRGCNNWCSHCAPVRLQRKGLRARKVEDIIAEIEHMGLKRGSFLFSTDLNITAIPAENLEELFRYLQDKGLRWVAEGTIAPLLEDIEKNGNLLKLMSAQNGAGGCYSFFYGADDLVIEKVKGSHDKEVELIKKAIEVFRKFDIPLNVSVMVGFDHHRYPDTFFRTATVLQRAGSPNTFFQITTPYPGTPIYKETRIFEENTAHFNHRQVVATPKQMTTEQLQQGFYWLLRQFNNPEVITQTARESLSSQIIRKNPTLSIFLSGILWGLERYLSLLELSARGYINPKIQQELDAEFKTWQKRNA